MAVSNQPWYQNQTFPSFDIPLNTDTGADDLTGVTIGNFTMTFRSSTGRDTLGTGTFSIKTVNPAEVYYKPSAADVSAAFTGTLIISAFFPPSNTSADEVVYDPIAFTITAI